MVASIHSLFPALDESDLVANPETVRILRTRKGFTLAYMAEQVGKKTPWASKIESGKLSLTGQLLHSYASILGVPVAKLTEELIPVTAEGLAFRKYNIPQKTVDKLQSECSVRLNIINSLLDLTRQRKPPRFPQYDVTYLDHGAASAAWMIRERWGVVGPIKNIAGHLEAEGIFVSTMPEEIKKVSAVTAWPDQTLPPIMLLSSTEPNDRRRFTLAHELGHLIMDRKSYTDEKLLERRADEFAGELLAPYALVREEFLKLSPGNVQGLLPLQAKWGLHPTAFVQRAKLHGDITQEDTARWFRTLNGTFRSLVASMAPSYPIEARAFSDLVQLLKSHNWYPQAIADYVNFYAQELIEVADPDHWPFKLPENSRSDARTTKSTGRTLQTV